MAQVNITGASNNIIPNEWVMQSGGTPAVNDSLVLDAVNESFMLVGRVMLAGRSGSKTLAASGGNSKIHLAMGASCVFAVGSNLRVGLQTVDLTAGPPARGDGTFDVYGDTAGSISSSSLLTVTMAAGADQTINQGDLICIAGEITTFTAADSLKFRSFTNGAIAQPSYTLRTSGPTFTAQSIIPNAILEFSDGTYGYMEFGFHMTTIGTQTFNSTTGTADEYGNIFQVPFPITVDGLSISWSGAAGDFEAILYSDPLGTPAVIEKVTVDANTISTTSSRGFILPFTQTRELSANTNYAVTYRPITASNVTLSYWDVGSAGLTATHPLGNTCYAIRRLDNTGAFSDFNGGTAKTRRFMVGVAVAGYSDGVGSGGLSAYGFSG